MNLKILSNQLSKLYNTLGNEWLVNLVETEPFDFRVFVRRADSPDDLHDYEVEIYTDRQMPKSFRYRQNKNSSLYEGIHLSVVSNYFKNLAKYVDPSFGEFRKTLGVSFMDVKPS